jgi:hypothetical protein
MTHGTIMLLSIFICQRIQGKKTLQQSTCLGLRAQTGKLLQMPKNKKRLSRTEQHGAKKDPGSWCGNDPSAGSPTETLLRLHLPLDDKV